ncbi:restriction endonuclease subunit S [uncultured Bifidobacterium sp.]|uniref:restriction endonuclease subunit S n=1 Tax=uncultured Bifidobacterium sp. TaxID=165187 RepID=UPI00260AAB41|nr:restriction endonuclease subunit S [uncultured Bifidobacterium sp.]
MTRIDTSNWKKFKIEDLFEKLQLDIKNESFNKTFDVSEERTSEFDLPLVNAKHGNNGIMYYGREDDFNTAEMTIDIVQNGAIATGDVYAQPQKTGVLWDAYLVKPKMEINSARTLLFLATVLEKAIKDRFSYEDKCIWEKVKLLSVTLPCTDKGNPDWAYMDAYMAAVMHDCEENLAKLKCILPQ